MSRNIIDIPLRGVITMFYYARISEHHRMTWDIAIYVRIRCNQYIIAN